MRGVLTMGTKEEHEKIDILDLELEKEFEDAEAYAQYRKIIRATMAQWLKNLKNGEIKLTSVSDLKTLIEADKILKN
ncbi:hypothetical protein A8L52_09490 [Enterococcus faecalis]|uniref:hypothetical protein n=1 Tax=Enterococcus faecalis TaxID=1351 RepID=UPI0008131F8D|nr:hypothetical protein [Enterococcus faecalis]OCK16274.1 hypothetical protein A8L52_09490 [Enterococcus faecalis]